MSFIPAEQIDIKAKVAFIERGDFGKEIEKSAGVILSILSQKELDTLEQNFATEADVRNGYLELLRVEDADKQDGHDDLLKFKAEELNGLAKSNIKALDNAINESIIGYAFEDDDGEWVAIELSEHDLELLEKRTTFKRQLRNVFIQEQRAAIRKN